jgi:hypothetical protein
VCYRHNWVRNPGRVAQPHAGRPSRPGTDGHDSASPGRPPAWRHQGDQEWDLLVLNVGIICPGSQRLVSKGTDTIPGKAAALDEGKKTKTYSDQASFVPFIVETGGRINAAGLQFLSRILPLEAEGTAGLTRRHGRAALRGSHGRWRFNRATCLHRLSRRYMRLIVLLKVRGRGAIAMIRTWVYHTRVW